MPENGNRPLQLGELLWVTTPERKLSEGHTIPERQELYAVSRTGKTRVHIVRATGSMSEDATLIVKDGCYVGEYVRRLNTHGVERLLRAEVERLDAEAQR